MIDTLWSTSLSLLAESAPHAGAIDTAATTSNTPWESAALATLYFVVDMGIVAVAVAFVMCLWRLLRGPTLADRSLGGDTLSMQVVGLAILLTIRMRTLMFFDAVLIISILGFASTLAFAQFIARRRAV